MLPVCACACALRGDSVLSARDLSLHKQNTEFLCRHSLSWRRWYEQHNVQLLKVADQMYVHANFATQRIALRLAHVLYPSLLTQVWLFVTADVCAAALPFHLLSPL
jgi:hypothetical protein